MSLVWLFVVILKYFMSLRALQLLLLLTFWTFWWWYDVHCVCVCVCARARVCVCVDINECIERPTVCRANQECRNTVGSYTCHNLITCSAGYRLNSQGSRCEGPPLFVVFHGHFWDVPRRRILPMEIPCRVKSFQQIYQVFSASQISPNPY